jgi:hypothetical protein
MQEDMKVLWVAALRSGEYPQGRKRLREETRFCCLGVLCDLYTNAHADFTWQKRYGQRLGDYTFVDATADYDRFPPHSVYDRWAGLSAGAMGKLAHLNDGGASFAEIAHWIEEHL